MAPALGDDEEQFDVTPQKNGQHDIRSNNPQNNIADDDGDDGEEGGDNKAENTKSAADGFVTNVRIGMVIRRWKVVNRIGAGSFGETFGGVEIIEGTAPLNSNKSSTHRNGEEDDGAVEDEEDGGGVATRPTSITEGREVCIKVEQESKNVLSLEVLALKKAQPCPQVVRYVGSGRFMDANYLVMERLGPNLVELRRSTLRGVFSIFTMLKVGISCLQAIRGVHELGLIHRDIKPSNFVVGRDPWRDGACYLIDFGLARRYRRSNGEVRPPRDDAGFRGTSRYASVRSHQHLDLGRVDDIWSLLFMLVEFATGTLPWRKYKEKDDIGRCKEETIGPSLVKNLPREFGAFLEHLQSVGYSGQPRYDYLISLLQHALDRRGYPADKLLDWQDPSMRQPELPTIAAPIADAPEAWRDPANPHPPVQQHVFNSEQLAFQIKTPNRRSSEPEVVRVVSSHVPRGDLSHINELDMEDVQGEPDRGERFVVEVPAIRTSLPLPTAVTAAANSGSTSIQVGHFGDDVAADDDDGADEDDEEVAGPTPAPLSMYAPAPMVIQSHAAGQDSGMESPFPDIEEGGSVWMSVRQPGNRSVPLGDDDDPLHQSSPSGIAGNGESGKLSGLQLDQLSMRFSPSAALHDPIGGLSSPNFQRGGGAPGGVRSLSQQQQFPSGVLHLPEELPRHTPNVFSPRDDSFDGAVVVPIALGPARKNNTMRSQNQLPPTHAIGAVRTEGAGDHSFTTDSIPTGTATTQAPGGRGGGAVGLAHIPPPTSHHHHQHKYPLDGMREAMVSSTSSSPRAFTGAAAPRASSSHHLPPPIEKEDTSCSCAMM